MALLQAGRAAAPFKCRRGAQLVLRPQSVGGLGFLAPFCRLRADVVGSLPACPGPYSAGSRSGSLLLPHAVHESDADASDEVDHPCLNFPIRKVEITAAGIREALTVEKDVKGQLVQPPAQMQAS